VTIYGPDISSYQHGLDLAKLASASFVLAKVTQGTYYTDADYPVWRRQAQAAAKPFGWYHFLTNENVQLQAAHTRQCVGDLTLPGMLDVEPANSYNPTWAQTLAYIDAAHAASLNLRLCYLPRWYWEQMGSPDLSALASRKVSLVASSYPGGAGTASQVYPGDGAAGWGSYGGMTPVLYQFTNQAVDGGQRIDYNAYRGSVAELTALLNGDDDVNPQDKLDIVNETVAALLAKLPPAFYHYGEEDVVLNGKVIHNTPGGHLMHGSWVSTNDPDGPVLKALAELHQAVVSIKHELDAVTAAVGKPVTP
jgi:hypothetical protein